MTQRMITIITQGESVVIEFKELEKHTFVEKYHMIMDREDLSELIQLFKDWCSGLDIVDSHNELRISL